MSVPCVFCDLVRTTPRRGWQSRSTRSRSNLSADTLAPGHTLVTPRIHRGGLFEPTDVELAAVMDLVRRVAEAMRTEHGSTGTFLLQASGPDSGGTVCAPSLPRRAVLG